MDQQPEALVPDVQYSAEVPKVKKKSNKYFVGIGLNATEKEAFMTAKLKLNKKYDSEVLRVMILSFNGDHL